MFTFVTRKSTVCLPGKPVLMPTAVYTFTIHNLKIERPVRNTAWDISKLEVLNERCPIMQWRPFFEFAESCKL